MTKRKTKGGAWMAAGGILLLIQAAIAIGCAVGGLEAVFEPLSPVLRVAAYGGSGVVGAAAFAIGYVRRHKGTTRAFAPLFLLPMAIAFAIGFVWPFIQGIYLSFFRFKTLRFTEFVGIDNYVRALSDPDFVASFRFTLVFTVVAVAAVNLAAFGLASALTKGIRGSTWFRTVFFMPNLIGGIVLGYVWKLILDGIIGYYFDSSLVLDATYGFWGLVVLTCWQQVGYMMIIYIAGLQNVPQEYVEAAKIDGAGGWQILRRITLPSVMPSITICTFLTLTNAFKLFDQNLALTGGKPYRETEMLALNIYNSFYESATNMGVGQAKAVTFFAVVVVIALTQLYFTGRKEVRG